MEKEKQVKGWLAGIFLLTLIVYAGSVRNGYVAWDDDWFVQQNPYVTDLSIGNQLHSFTSFYNGQYSPLTALVMGIEFKLGGSSPVVFHLMSLLFHLLNGWLVFLLSRFIFKKSLPALLITGVFLLHPMQTESISWISAQKVLIYSTFFLLSLVSYTRYLSSGYKRPYLLYTGLFFFLSFLAKEQAFTLSISLLALDYLHQRNLLSKKVLLEKLPFILVSVVMGLITLASTKTGEFYSADKDKPGVLIQLVYSSYSYLLYGIKIIIPSSLSAFYPYPDESDKSLFPVYYYLGILVAGFLLFWVIRNFRKHILPITGLLFFTINILPVLQVMPLRDFMIADRYVYLPIIGFLIIPVWMIERFSSYKKTNILLSSFSALLLIYSVLSFQQSKVWKSSLDLFNQVVKTYPDSSIGLNNRGLALQSDGKYAEAISDFKSAIALNPTSLFAYNNISIAYNKINQPEEAIIYLNKAIESRGEFAQAYFNRADSYSKISQFAAAIRDYTAYIKLRPEDYKAFIARGIAYFKFKQPEAALADMNQAVKLAPGESSYLNRGVIYLNMKKFDQAIADFTRTLELNPGFSYAYFNRGISYSLAGNRAAGCQDLSMARQLGFPQAEQAIQQYCQP